jgi:D-glycero-D-manno-heptose 1,7-bisphosphate phosphatase
MQVNLQKAVFIDKDGTLIPDIPFNVEPDLVSIEPETISGLKLLHDNGYKLIIISNQPGIAKGYFTEKALDVIWSRINSLLSAHKLKLDAFYYCPHDVKGIIQPYAISCNCQKPSPGLLFRAAADWNIALKQSWMVGDILNDIEAGNRAGCKSILIKNDNETEWLMNPERIPLNMVENVEQAARFIVKHDNYEHQEFESFRYHQSIFPEESTGNW